MRAVRSTCTARADSSRTSIASAKHVEESLMLVTALNPHIGYEKAAAIALKAHHEHLSLRDAALGSGFVTPEQYDAWIDPAAMANPHRTR